MNSQISSIPLIILPRIILRSFIQEHTEWNFVYGADYFRKGVLGQMWQCHGEPNAFPITTCYKMCPSSSSKYWNDSWELAWETVNTDLAAIPQDKPILPLRKIGCGNSRMNVMAPRLWVHMMKALEKIKHYNIRIDYNAN